MDKIEEMFWAAVAALFVGGIVYITQIATPVWLVEHKSEMTAFIWWMIGINIITLMLQRAKQMDKFRRRTHHSKHFTDGCKYS